MIGTTCCLTIPAIAPRTGFSSTWPRSPCSKARESTGDTASLRRTSPSIPFLGRRTAITGWVYFQPHPTWTPLFSHVPRDAQGSGFDRGHLAPAGNHKQSQEYCNETFYLSNIAPQVGAGFNRDKWEHLERYVRKMTKRYKNVYVCTGPLYLPKRESDGKNYVK